MIKTTFRLPHIPFLATNSVETKTPTDYRINGRPLAPSNVDDVDDDNLVPSAFNNVGTTVRGGFPPIPAVNTSTNCTL